MVTAPEVTPLLLVAVVALRGGSRGTQTPVGLSIVVQSPPLLPIPCAVAAFCLRSPVPRQPPECKLGAN